MANNKRDQSEIDDSKSSKKLKNAEVNNQQSSLIDDTTSFSHFINSFNDKNKNNFKIIELLNYIRSTFAKRSFPGLPPLFYLHQLYILANRTIIDRQIDNLRSNNKIRAFKCDDNEVTCLCFTDDFISYIKEFNENIDQDIINKYLKLLEHNNQMFIQHQESESTTHLSEFERTELIKLGLLTIKDSTSYWFSIPAIGRYRKTLLNGRRCLLQLLKKKKYNEIDIDELNAKNLKKINEIGLIYLISDLIGTDKIRRIETSNSFIIKLIK
jgi:hypothetical protein